MSVIIRLQNLPWSANALDIRQYFKGLSIPDGGVHIVGGEMGDAFIAFSTDEDARQAMMKDRGKLNEVQIRLLLSSRTEMQKVIETARQQSLLALQKAGAIPATPAPAAATQQPTPQPPVITTNSLQNILNTQLGVAPSFQTYQKQAGITLTPTPKPKAENVETKSRRESNESASRDRRRSSSKDRRRSRSRDRTDRSSGRRRRERTRSRSRERDRDRKGGRQRSSRRSRSRERSRERSRDHGRNTSRTTQNSKEKETNSSNRYGRENTHRSSTKNVDPREATAAASATKPHMISPWNVTPINAYQTNVEQQQPNAFGAPPSVAPKLPSATNAYTTATTSAVHTASKNNTTTNNSTAAEVPPSFQNYSTSSNTTTTNNYSVNILANPLGAASSSQVAGKPAFALQNPYTATMQTTAPYPTNTNAAALFQPSMPQTNSSYPIQASDKNAAATAQQPTVQPYVGGGTSSIPTQQSNFLQTQPPPQLLPQQQPQQPIAFANTNPYAQIYPTLFAQAAAAGTGIAGPVRSNNSNLSSSPQDQKFGQRMNNTSQVPYRGGNSRDNCDSGSNSVSYSIKISNMCAGTTYSDLRKFLSGLFIPHNGIKMVNDRIGVRTGVAYVRFSRSTCVSKAIIRNNTFLKTQRVTVEIVSDEEFDNIEDSYNPHRERDHYNRSDRNDFYGGDGDSQSGVDNDYNSNSPLNEGEYNDVRNADEQFGGNETSRDNFNIIYIEDIPNMATEHDIMKMFSSYTIFDILLTENLENRRELTAYVRFSREDEASGALMDSSRHFIGHRKLRMRPARAEEMEKAKEKLRLANEQLRKEEDIRQISADRETSQGKHNNELRTDVSDTIKEGANNPSSLKDSSSNDFQQEQHYRTNEDAPSDPRLRHLGHNNRFLDNDADNSPTADGNGIGGRSTDQYMNQPKFNAHNQRLNAPLYPPIPMNIENNFVILKNCDYNTRVNDVAELLMSANLEIRHVELLRNERNLPTGEFIVEFTHSEDAATAHNRCNNITFRNRNLRVHRIQPQEIADRIGKPFLNHFPGGGGRGGAPHSIPMLGNFDFPGRRPGGGPPHGMANYRMHGGFMGPRGDRYMGSRFGRNMPPNSRGRGGFGDNGGGGRKFGLGPRGRGGNRNYNRQDDTFMEGDSNQNNMDDSDSNADKGDMDDEVVSISSNGPEENTCDIPEKFNRSNCVIAMENIPHNADLKDIIEFFGDVDVAPDDIIRRFNDDGTPTGDARVAFDTPAKALAAYEAKMGQSIFTRAISMNII